MHRRSPAKLPDPRDPRGWTTCVIPPPKTHWEARLRRSSDSRSGLLIKVMQQTCPRILADYLRTAEPQIPSDAQTPRIQTLKRNSTTSPINQSLSAEQRPMAMCVSAHDGEKPEDMQSTAVRRGV